MRKADFILTFFLSILLIAFSVAAVEKPAPFPLPFDDWEASDNESSQITISIEKRTPEDGAVSMKATYHSGQWPGVRYPKYDEPTFNCSGREGLIVEVYSSINTDFVVKLADADSKDMATMFNYEKKIATGRNLIQIPLSDIAAKLDLTKIKRIWLFPTSPPAGSVIWYSTVEFGDLLPEPELTKEQWDLNPDEARPNPFADPMPDMILWHRYNEKAGWEDVLDWSHHGNIGEFMTADKIRTGPLDTANFGIRTYGNFSKGKSIGYRVMPMDEDPLTEGCVSFWMMIDPNLPMKKGVILCGGGKAGKKKAVTAIKGKRGAEIQVTFGKKISAKDIPIGEWVHVAWAFDKSSQEIFINGESKVKKSGGATLDGSQGFFVGQDGSKWSKSHTGSSGFAGALDELRIYNKRMATFPGMSDGPSSSMPNLGLAVWLDFETDSPTNKASSRISCTDSAIVQKGVAGDTKWRKKDKAWQFAWNRNDVSSYVEIPVNPLMNIPAGTMEIRFKIDKYADHSYYHSLYVFNPYKDDSGSRPKHMLEMNCFSNNKGDYDPGAASGMKMTIDNNFEDDFNGNMHLDPSFTTGEWIKLVISWEVHEDVSDSFVDVWLNDKFVKRYPQIVYQLYGAGKIRVGGFTHTSELSQGAYMTVSDLKIYNYRRSIYFPDH